MLSRRIAKVAFIDAERSSVFVQRIETDLGPAINFTETAGPLDVGDTVLVNRTAVDLGLGTGGYDFVIARVSPPPRALGPAERGDAHLMKLRYTPLQHSARHIEDIPDFAPFWDTRLDGFPVICGELHSQLAPVAAALCARQTACLHVMTDGAALPSHISELLRSLAHAQLPVDTITVGQAYGTYRDLSAVSIHNALLFARHTQDWQAAFVCQGPGNTGTGTKYGFSGIEQAASLDSVAALGGAAICCVRASSTDGRERHRPVSHHTITVLELTRSSVVVPVPEGLATPFEWTRRHDVRVVARERTQSALDLLSRKGVDVRTMGRSVDDDPLFFHAAAAAGIIAAEIAVALA